MRPNLIFILFLIMLTSVCDTINQLFLKSAVNSLDLSLGFSFRKVAHFIIRIIATPRVWVGFIFSLISLGIWLFVLSKSDLSFAFTADSMHYIFIALASRFILKENVGSQRWLGTFLIIIGIVLVSIN